jgi:hypothetical protein
LEIYLAGFKTGEYDPGWFSKALSATQRNLCPRGAKHYIMIMKVFSKFKNLLGTKKLRTLIKLTKAQLKKL